MKKQQQQTERAVLVTTSYNAIIFGYADDTDGPTINLKRARLCVYWSSDMRGFMGLAVIGPSSNCKIGPAGDIQVRQVTSVTEVTPEAIIRWEKSPWS